MADLSDILQQAMANPQIMGQVAALAQSLGLQNAGQSPAAPPPSIPAGNEAKPVQTPPQNSGTLSPAMPQPDPGQLMGNLLQMSKTMGGDQRQMALIQALKPFIRPERARKLERAIQIARMSRLAEQALGSLSGNFSQAGDRHV